MDDNWRKVREIFDSAIRRPPEERQKFIVEASGEDHSLRAEVESLLSSLDDAEVFLETPVVFKVADVIHPQTMPLKSGTQLGHYEIIKRIGVGGMGEVFLAKDTKLNRKVALKLLAAHITEDQNGVSRFRQEAFATSALNHPNIVTIYEIGKWREQDFIVTEYIEGETLRRRLRGQKFSASEAVSVALQIASALAAAHSAKIVHRDIKPENVMIREDGLIKILDFGIAKYRPAEKGQKTLIETEAGEIIGTAAYMSPEQARGLAVDARTDIWSLGVILYEMLEGRLPFDGETKADRLAAILERQPAPLSKMTGKDSPPLQKIIDRALAKDKNRRYPNIAEVAADLHELHESTGDKFSAPLVFPARKRPISPRPYLFAAVLSLVLLGAVGLWFYLSALRKTVGGERKSIAVLPLKPINQANRDDIYEIGIADSLIQRLGATKNFVVRPLSAVRRFAGIEQDPIVAGKEQQVEYVLTSNYQLAGGKIRITSALLNVESGQIEETYKAEKDAGNIFAMQDAVAAELGNILQSHFNFTRNSSAKNRGTDNEEAYRLYLQGVYFNDRRLPPDGEKAVASFEQAVRLDPNYAKAWAGAAFAHRSLVDIGAAVDVHEQNRISMEAVNKALALDPNLSEAYNALCLNKLNYEYDVGGAETACKRAIELDPNSPLAHNTYARLLFSSQSRRFDEAIAEIKIAIDLDPTSFYHQLVYTVALTYARRYDEAVQQLERLAERNPKRAVVSFWVVNGVSFQGKTAEDFERLKRFQKLAETDESTVKITDTAYQTAGWQGVLRERAKFESEHAQVFYFSACLYAQIGDKDQAIEYLEKTFQHREHWMAYIQVDPRFDSIRGDPRFAELVRKVESK